MLVAASRRRVGMLAVFALAAAGCRYDARPTAEAVANARREQQASSALVAADTAVDPCADFYHYACNSWIREHPPRPERPLVGRGLDGVQERTRLWMFERLSAPGASATGDPLAVLYASCMNEEAATERGLRDAPPLFQAIDAGSDPPALVRAAAALHRAGVPALFGVAVVPDWTAPARGLLRIGPTPLPSQAFLGDDAAGWRARERYRSYVKVTLDALDEVPDPVGAADHAIAIERRLAAAWPPPAQVADAQRLDGAAFDRLVAPVPFADYFAAAGIAPPAAVAVAGPGYLEAVRALVVDDGPAVQDYLRWSLVRALAPELPGVIRDVRFEYEKGVPTPRWQHCVEVAEVILPDEVARLYEHEAVSADARAAVGATAEAIQRAAVRRLERADWLDAAARRTAVDKVARMGVRVGRADAAAPPVPLHADAYLANLLAANGQAWERMVAQLVSGPDPSIGLAPTSTANAFYRRSFNDVVIALALAQPPFLGGGQTAAASHGGLGAAIGHEIAHAFDRAGRRVDASGRWFDWAAASDEAIRVRERCLSERLAQETAAPGVALVGATQPIPAATVDAELTVDEQQADVAGVIFALDAFREHVATHPDAPAAATGTERILFLAYAQSWCTSVHPLMAHWLARADVHAPPPARVNATLAQVPDFAAAFDCPAGAPLHPRQTCALW